MLNGVALPGTHLKGAMRNTRLLRRIKRMVLFVLLGCVALNAATFGSGTAGLQIFAEVIILVACWATISFVEDYIQEEETRAIARAELARLEGARLTANAMQDRIANKLSVTVGYCEILATDSRLPLELRDQALRAMEGAAAAARTMSELRRLTREFEDSDDLPDLELMLARATAAAAKPSAQPSLDEDALETDNVRDLGSRRARRAQQQ